VCIILVRFSLIIDGLTSRGLLTLSEETPPVAQKHFYRRDIFCQTAGLVCDGCFLCGYELDLSEKVSAVGRGRSS
jgi:hypothetical protein